MAMAMRTPRGRRRLKAKTLTPTDLGSRNGSLFTESQPNEMTNNTSVHQFEWNSIADEDSLHLARTPMATNQHHNDDRGLGSHWLKFH